MEISVGQRLKQAREALGISLDDAARATHIKVNYLQELENDHPELLPSPTNARGFLRLYASLLKIPAQPLIDAWATPAEPAAPVQPVAAAETAIETPAASVKEIEAEKGGEGQEPAEDAARGDQATDTSSAASVESTKAGKKEKTTGQNRPTLTVFNSITDYFKKIGQQKKAKPGKSVKQPEVTATAPVQPVDASEWQPETTQGQAGEGGKADESAKKPAEADQPAGEATPVLLKNSDEYFAEIGQALRQQRETLNLNLADIERFTHIKRPLLEAMEAGDFSKMPSTVQGRGLLNSYAAFLSMDGQGVMSLFASALEAQRLERLPPSKPEPIVSGGIRVNIPERFKKYLSTDMIFGGAIIIFMFFFLLWGAISVFTENNPTPTATAPSVSEVLSSTQTIEAATTVIPSLVTSAEISETGAPAVLQATQAPPTPFATQNTAPLQLYIVAQQRTYLRVTVDGEVVFDGRAAPGDAFTYYGQESIDLLTGNASALEVYFNEDYLGKLGEVGEVINLTFNESGYITPTPRPITTPTRTSTPQPTATP